VAERLTTRIRDPQVERRPACVAALEPFEQTRRTGAAGSPAAASDEATGILVRKAPGAGYWLQRSAEQSPTNP
jgi:hypothetical protein